MPQKYIAVYVTKGTSLSDRIFEHSVNELVSPFILDDGVQSSHQFVWSHIMDVERQSYTACYEASHVLSLIAKQWEHQHGNAVTDALVDPMGAAMSHEDFSFGMTWGETAALWAPGKRHQVRCLTPDLVLLMTSHQYQRHCQPWSTEPLQRFTGFLLEANLKKYLWSPTVRIGPTNWTHLGDHSVEATSLALHSQVHSPVELLCISTKPETQNVLVISNTWRSNIIMNDITL